MKHSGFELDGFMMLSGKFVLVLAQCAGSQSCCFTVNNCTQCTMIANG